MDLVDPRATHAPEAYAALCRLEADVIAGVPAELVQTARRRVAMALGLEPWTPFEGAVETFTEQFVIDVTAVDVAPLAAELGATVGPFVQALWVVDLGTRTDIALEKLFGAPVQARTAVDATDFNESFEVFLRVVAQLRNLDAVTSELVRLRGARFHNCRLCKSLRTASALRDGADEAMFDKIDRYESSDLDEKYKVALRLTDAIVTQPSTITNELVEQARAQFSDVQLVELALDVMRNAANKVAVAFGADAPNVTEGIELYDVLPDGNLVYGLTEVGS
jgi:alkylhydroperoxidase family enzyme